MTNCVCKTLTVYCVLARNNCQLNHYQSKAVLVYSEYDESHLYESLIKIIIFAKDRIPERDY